MASALSLSEAQLIASRANPGLTALSERATAASERIEQSRAWPDPKFQVTYFGESVQTRTGPQEAIYAFSQTIPWYAKNGRKEDFARSEASAVELAYEEASLRLSDQVAQSYYEAAYLQKALESTEANLVLLRDLESVVDARVRGGGDLNQLLRLTLEIERNEDTLARLEQKTVSTHARLQALLGRAVDEVDPLQAVDFDRWREADLRSLQSALIARNPELMSRQQSIESAGFRAELAKLKRYPDITLGLNYIEVGDPISAGTPDGGVDPWAVTIAVSIPLWEGNTRSEIREAHALRRSAEASFQDRVLQLKADLSEAVASRDEAALRMERYDTRLLPLARQALENTQAGYVSGKLSILDLIDSERSVLDLQLNYWRAVADYNQSLSKIRSLVGYTETL